MRNVTLYTLSSAWCLHNISLVLHSQVQEQIPLQPLWMCTLCARLWSCRPSLMKFHIARPPPSLSAEHSRLLNTLRYTWLSVCYYVCSHSVEISRRLCEPSTNMRCNKDRWHRQFIRDYTKLLLPSRWVCKCLLDSANEIIIGLF